MKKTELQEHIRKLELSLLSDEVRRSADRLSELLSDDFFEFGSSGTVWHRTDYLNEFGIGKVTMRISDFQIRRLDDNAVLATYQALNVESKARTLRSSIWIYKNQKWQMDFHQGTKVKD
ncbi:DUF4440 domain-containing protein [Sporolactobacillus shoreicorticis]|uniref:DUF4440 domain-containing protein n=1 Tax=Sporolactobacillus shoreicorticis TaxID=1923877 RepID=A0ABW5S242_9BACL|nr:DUF4440 domain-containing protein [Sporolactobacillus shoreicorticis]MCO7125432.1 DUF4440 domain-containing protein [Sporolactobacillus shoreicorticis]